MEISASASSPIPFYVLIAAAGGGSRFGGVVPKQYRKLAGEPVLRRTVDCFRGCPGLQELRVIIGPEHEDLYKECFAGGIEPVFCLGNKDRFSSIYNGLLSFSNLKNQDIILIHDAARPFITPAEIEQLVAATAQHGAATLARPVTDTVKYAEGGYVDRNGLWTLQTPQGFRYGLLRQAHEAMKNPGTTDDTSLVAALGHPIELVLGSRDNIKITTPEDWPLAEKIMMEKTAHTTRTGLGFDVHAFDAAKPGPVRLCGIDVPHPRALEGHSDADVGLHALTDALLGALAAGDIGEHFPSSDMRWKNEDSKVFLQHAMNLLRDRGGTLTNFDLTIICENPRVGPHRAAMQARVAEICGIGTDQISIKGTTTQRLGLTGRGEGIAAQAVATITLPQET